MLCFELFGRMNSFLCFILHIFAGIKREEAELITNIDDSCLYYEFLHFMDEKMYSVEPVMVSTPSYEFQPMADVEKEFLSLFEELKEKIREEESKK